MLENALVLPILILVVSGIIMIGLLIFRYQQVAMLAREGARYASVHGAQYQADSTTGEKAASAADVYNNAILPMAVGMDTSILTYSVTWSDSGKSPVVASTTSDPPGQPVGTTVTVTVSYVWSGVTVSSTSVMPMQY